MWKFLTTALLALGLWASAAGVHAQTCGLRDNGDGTMTDPKTGLQIRTCAEGQSWAGGRCSGKASGYKWDVAVQQFGSGEWRLITKEEASRMAPDGSERCGFGPTWTSSLYPRDDKWAVAVVLQNDRVVQEAFQRGVSDSIPVQLVRSSRASSGTSASSNTQRPAPGQNAQQATAPVPPAAYNKPTRDRPDLMGHGCDVGQGSTVKNGCSEIINYVLCIVRHPDGRTTGPDTCQGGQIRPGNLLPQGSRLVTFIGEGSSDYLVAACKHPARPYNVRYLPGQGLSVSCGEF